MYSFAVPRKFIPQYIDCPVAPSILSSDGLMVELFQWEAHDGLPELYHSHT